MKAVNLVLNEIATIAHAGGLSGLDMWEALAQTRELSLPWWDKKVRQNPRSDYHL